MSGKQLQGIIRTIQDVYIPPYFETLDKDKLENAYLNGNIDEALKAEWSPQVVLPLLALIGDAKTGRKAYLVGNPGTGKTLLLEILPSLVYAVPPAIIERTILKGNPDETWENIVGVLDVGKLQKGETRVLWDPRWLIANIGYMGIDELNRFSPRVQNQLIQLADTTGDLALSLYGDFIRVSSRPSVIATGNPFDINGVYKTSQALLDRFDIGIPYVAPPVFLDEIIEYRQKEIKDKLDESKFVQRFDNILNKFHRREKSLDELVEEANSLRYEYSDYMKQQGIYVMNPDELKKIKEEIRKTEIDKDVKDTMQVLSLVLNYPKSEEDLPSRYFRGEIFTGRSYQSLNWLVRAMKWYFDSIGVNINDKEILEKALPYVLFHRSFNLATQEGLAEVKETNQYREGMDYLYYWDLAKMVSKEAIEKVDSIVEALREYNDNIPTAIAMMRVSYKKSGMVDDRLKLILFYLQ